MKKLSILVYLNSGGNNGKSKLSKLQNACNKKNIDYKIYTSKYPQHTKKLIQEIVTKTKHLENHKIVVVGGDGTLNEALQGLLEINCNYPISYFPAGTGNDFARSLNLTSDENKFLDNLFNVEKENIEVIYAVNNIDNSNYVAVNGIGIGFDAIVSKLHSVNKSNKNKLFKKFSYLSETISAYKKSNTYNAKIYLDDKYEYKLNNILFLSFMNNCYYGGGIKIDPYSYKNNNKISLIVVKDVTKNIIPKLLYHVLFTGNQFEKVKDNIQRISGKSFTVIIEKEQYIQADGEVTKLKGINMNLKLIDYPFYLVES